MDYTSPNSRFLPKVRFCHPDKRNMYISPSNLQILLLILALIVLTLYIMRRRVRLGRKKGKF